MDPTATVTAPPEPGTVTLHQPQPLDPQPFTTVSFKKHHRRHGHRDESDQPADDAAVVYKECLKNHAASLGGRALDGCGEFFPSPATTPTDPTSFKCAACGCHRNFHRREFRRRSPSPQLSLSPSPPPPRPPPPPPPQFAAYTHQFLGLDKDSHRQQPAVAIPTTPRAVRAEKPNGRKRFRTRFSQEQKEKMYLFSVKMQWRLQKCDESVIEEFCKEVGVSKGVLKVWMHNNKHTFGKKTTSSNNNDNNNISSSSTLSNGRVSFEDHHRRNGHNDAMMIESKNNGGAAAVDDDDDGDEDRNSNSQNRNESIGGADFHVSINGSSSSS